MCAASRPLPSQQAASLLSSWEAVAATILGFFFGLCYETTFRIVDVKWYVGGTHVAETFVTQCLSLIHLWVETKYPLNSDCKE